MLTSSLKTHWYIEISFQTPGVTVALHAVFPHADLVFLSMKHLWDSAKTDNLMHFLSAVERKSFCNFNESCFTQSRHFNRYRKGTKAMLTVNDRLKTLVAAHRPKLNSPTGEQGKRKYNLEGELVSLREFRVKTGNFVSAGLR